MAGANNIASTSNVAGVSVAVGTSNLAGKNAFPLTVTFLGANITPGVGGSTSANFNLGASGSVDAIQATFATYPGIPRDNLRMLEIISNFGAFASDPPDLEMGLCSSNSITLWRRRYKHQEDQIQSLTRDIDTLLKENIDKNVSIVD